MTEIYYVGMDVHKAITVIVVIDSTGKEVRRFLVETKSSVLVDTIKSIRGEVHLTLEEGIHSQWLYDLLSPYVTRLIVCNPRYNKLIQEGNKSDDIDAFRLADLLRIGSLKAVYKGENSLRKLQQLARSYLYLVQDSTRIKNRIKALYRSRGIVCEGESAYHREKRKSYLKQLTEPGMRLRAELLYKELDSIEPLAEQAKAVMIAEARRHSAYKLLKTIPSLGPIRVSLIMAVMLTPHRFRTKRQLWTYIGLAVKTHSSSDYEKQDGRIKKTKRYEVVKGLNKNFNRILKMVFKMAARSVRKGVLKDYLDTLLAKGTNSQMAMLTLARKIAALVLSVWKKGEKFEAKKFVYQKI